MCGGGIAGLAGGLIGGLLGIKKPEAPAPVTVDPAAERANAEAEASRKAGAKLTMTSRAMRENSLLTGAGESKLGAPAAAPAAPARTTLGV